MLAKIAAADSASTVIKKYSVFIYSEAEPHAKYAIYKHTRKFRVLQYMYIYRYVCVCNYMYTYNCAYTLWLMIFKKVDFEQ